MAKEDFFVQNPAEKWKLSPEKSIELVSGLDEALKNKNFDEIKDILSDPQKIRKMLLDRSEKGKNLIVLRNSFDVLLMERFGQEADIYSVDSEKILDWINEMEMPEYVLNEMLTTAYHLKDQRRFFRLLTIISENEAKLKDKSVMTKALHDLATWESTATNNPKKGLELNKSILGSAREAGDRILESKIQYGITYNKDIKPKEKAEDFEKYARVLEENGDEYDSIQALNEAADSYISITKIPGKGGVKRYLPDNIDKALFLAKTALEKAEKIDYSNAILKAHRVLHKIYKETGDQAKAAEHLKEANKAKRETGYRY